MEGRAQKLYENVLDLVLGTLYITSYINHQDPLDEFGWHAAEGRPGSITPSSCKTVFMSTLARATGTHGRVNCKTHVSMFLGHKMLLTIETLAHWFQTKCPSHSLLFLLV
jgi:hypothetical protein